MVATPPVNRIGAHFDSPPAPKHLLPKSETERGLLWSDILFEAALTLRDQLRSRNEAVAAAAANSLLDLERTRMRHGKPLAGSNDLSEAQREFEDDSRVVPAADIDDEDDEDEQGLPQPAVPAAARPRPRRFAYSRRPRPFRASRTRPIISSPARSSARTPRRRTGCSAIRRITSRRKTGRR